MDRAPGPDTIVILIGTADIGAITAALTMALVTTTDVVTTGIAGGTTRWPQAHRSLRLAARHRLDDGVELPAHRQVEAGARRQAAQEPALVLAIDFPIRRELLEGIPHHLRELRVVLAKHDAVRVIRQIVADHAVLAARAGMLRDQAIH